MKQNEANEIKVLSSLVKIFPDREPISDPNDNILTGLRNETVSFQVAYNLKLRIADWVSVKVDSPISDTIRIRRVDYVPAVMVGREPFDDNYLSTEAGIFPDLLCDMPENKFVASSDLWHSFWIDIKITENTPEGIHPISISLEDNAGKILASTETSVTVFNATLPDQTLIRTEWFHADCLANFYQVEVFSEEHWRIIENFIKSATNRGCNMILTPIFTPPLDTAIGGERTTVQLIDVSVTRGSYYFDFTKLKRWIDLSLSAGMKYIEFSHLFTQWGAKAAPKILARVDGTIKQIFGWDTPSVGGEYTKFLHAFLPQLIEKLEEWNIPEKAWFHISDEPTIVQTEDYRAAKESIIHLLEGFHVIDALSDFEFYKTGLVEHPIPSNDHIEAFLEADIKGLWTYYCTSQHYRVSNRFMSMPSQRNRIIGTQMYKYNIKGFLQWGFNFYNSAYSLTPINPYQVTDALAMFPAGDSFLVYPKADGTPEESIRMMVFYQGLTDMRAFQYLESLTDKEFVMNLIEGDLSEPITFSTYPTTDSFTIQLRNQVNQEIASRIS